MRHAQLFKRQRLHIVGVVTLVVGVVILSTVVSRVTPGSGRVDAQATAKRATAAATPGVTIAAAAPGETHDGAPGAAPALAAARPAGIASGQPEGAGV